MNGHSTDLSQTSTPPASTTHKAILAGAITALAIALIHAQAFRAEVFGLPGLAAWYLGSLLTGCAAGFAAGLLARHVPARLGDFAAYAGGALLAIAGYALQVYIFMVAYFNLSGVVWQ